MHIKTTRENLLGAATRAASFANKRSTMPILANALFEASDIIRVTATDMERQIVDTFDADIIEQGSFTVPIATILEIVRKLPKGALVEITSAEGVVSLKSGRYATKVNTLPVEDYPVFSSFDPDICFVVPSQTLKTVISDVSFAMSNEETRYYLNGVYIHTDDDKMKFVATDGHRLALSRITGLDVEGSLDAGVIVPRQTIHDLSRLLESEMDISVKASDSRISFTMGSAVITSKLIDGSFPDYKRVIPTGNDKKINVNAGMLSTVIDRVSAVSSEKSRPVKMSISDNEMVLSCTTQENSAFDVIDIEYNSDNFEIGFQAKYVNDVLANITGESVWAFGEGSSPVIVKSKGNSDHMFVIMPMRV